MMLPDDLNTWVTKGGLLSGVELARKIKSFKPQIKIVMVSNAVHDLTSAGLIRNKIIEKYYWKPHLYEAPGFFVREIKRIQKNGCAPAHSFIVHGHDTELINELKIFVADKLQWPPPRVLEDLPSATRTIIEKFEAHAADTDVVFVLLTANDGGPRPNVMYEFGYFVGKFGRMSGRIILLKKGSVEIPTDLHGVICVDVTSGLDSLQETLQRELPYYFRI
jgi:predicted nucleotide-binding protein